YRSYSVKSATRRRGINIFCECTRRSGSVDIGLANGLPLIEEHDIFRMDRHRGTREDQTSAEAHLHTENLAIDGDSTSQPAPNARPVMRAKFGKSETVAARLRFGLRFRPGGLPRRMPAGESDFCDGKFALTYI